MNTLLLTHKACIEHDPGIHHPECPARLRAVLNALEAEEFQLLDRREAPRAEIDQIARVHDREYVHAVLDAIPAEGRRALDGDTHVSPGSGEAALRAAGAACAAVDAVAAGGLPEVFTTAHDALLALATAVTEARAATEARRLDPLAAENRVE